MAHSHRKLPLVLAQVALFLHGEASHSLMSSVQFWPCQPIGKKKKMRCVTWKGTILSSHLWSFKCMWAATQYGLSCSSLPQASSSSIYLRNRSTLAVNCWAIIQCLEVICKGDQIKKRKARVIYLLTTAYSTIHALELIYFNSNTQEKMKRQLQSSDSSNFPPLHWRNPAKGLTVTQVFTCICYVYTM